MAFSKHFLLLLWGLGFVVAGVSVCLKEGQQMAVSFTDYYSLWVRNDEKEERWNEKIYHMNVGCIIVHG